MSLFFTPNARAQTPAFWDSVYTKPSTFDTMKVSKPDFVPSVYCLDNKVEKVLDSLADLKRRAKLIPGFRILLYSGNDREMASKAKENAYRVFPDANVYTTYQAPTFKVKLGDYFQKVEAFHYVKKLQSLFPQAVIIQEIVNIKN